MGIMDQVINSAISGAVPGGSNPLIGAAIQLLTRSGGISGLQQKFQSNGLGHVASSWIGTEQNLPIEEHQLHQVFGQDQLNEVAKNQGMPVNDLTSQLSRFLPNFVNEMTPQGNMPSGQPDMQSMLSMGMRLLNR